MSEDEKPRNPRRSYHIAMDGRVAVSYEPDRETKTIRIEDPVARFAAGVLLSPQEALQPQWGGMIIEAGAEWFLPLIRRMAAGERVSLEQVGQAYREANGSALHTFQDEIDGKN
jgi:hypothetical protein